MPHSAQRKHAFIGKIKEMSKENKLPARKKIALELLHQILGHRSTRSLLAGYIAKVVICTAVTYTPYSTSSKEQTGDVITFAQF